MNLMALVQMQTNQQKML